MTITVTASDVRDAANKLGVRFGADIELTFQSADYGRIKKPGFKVRVQSNSYKNREFSTLRSALRYIERLHNSRLKSRAS